MQSEFKNTPLRSRPGFLIRRLHQIHIALFNKACSKFEITPVQFSLMSALAVRGKADLTTLASDVALDRITSTGALKRLESRGFINRYTKTDDRRSQECQLTEKGYAILERMQIPSARAHQESLEGLSKSEQKALVELLKKVVAFREGLA